MRLMTTDTDVLLETDFLTFERNSDTKHELIFNEIIEMSGASKEHNRIVHSLAGLFYVLFSKNAEFDTFHNDMRVFDSISSSYFYPDLIVVEGTSEFLDNEFDTLINPLFIVEVLSPSTEKRDLSDKFEIYKSIPSLKEYMIVAQHKPYIKLFKKIPINHWELFEFDKLTEMVSILDNKFQLPLSEIYKKVF